MACPYLYAYKYLNVANKILEKLGKMLIWSKFQNIRLISWYIILECCFNNLFIKAKASTWMEELATVSNMKNLKTFIGISVCAYLYVTVS